MHYRYVGVVASIAALGALAACGTSSSTSGSSNARTIVNGTSVSLPSGTTSYATQISDAQSKGAQFIFFGGTSGNGCGLVRRDMTSGNLNVPFLGPDGCQDTKFITDSNSGSSTMAAEGSEATSAPDVSKLPSSANFYTQYKQYFTTVDPNYADGTKEPYTPYGYDAMNILIQAIQNVLIANSGQPPSDSTTFRDAVVTQLHTIQYNGALGHTSFDMNGDTTNTGFTLYKVSGGSWTTVNTYKVDTSGNVSAASGSSSSPPAAATSAAGASTLTSCSGTITVATDLPLTGGDSTDGPYPEHGAHLAVIQANQNHALGGCTLNYVSKDDSSVAKNGHDPAKGAANMAALAADTSVVGVVGPFNSSVALAEIPVASMNHLAMISPANTNPCLTVVVPVCSDPTIKIDTASLYKGPHTYFRVIASDVQQGEIDAYIAYHELGFTKVYVMDDAEAYGRGIALLFSKYFTGT